MINLEVLRPIIHYGLHLVFPSAIAWKFYPDRKIKAYALFLATMLIDLDHLLANPIYDPTRCSIGFHPLHSTFALIIYLGMLVPKKTRIIGIGLVLHLCTDFIDCILMKI